MCKKYKSHIPKLVMKYNNFFQVFYVSGCFRIIINFISLIKNQLIFISSHFEAIVGEKITWMQTQGVALLHSEKLTILLIWTA